MSSVLKYKYSNKYDIERIVLFIFLFTCRECRNIQDEIG